MSALVSNHFPSSSSISSSAQSDPLCPTCRFPIHLTMVEDEHNGDCICRQCGTVLGQVIDESPLKRVYEKDNPEEKASKLQHTTYDPLLQDTIRSTNHRLDGDEDFLHEGYGAIEHAFSRLFPDIGHDSATRMAKFFFKKAFQSQLEQKRGIKVMKRKTKDETHRKKFARRKAFVVSAILAALRKEGIRRPGTKEGDSNEWFDVYDLNRYVEGKDVTPKSKVKCWNELGISWEVPQQTQPTTHPKPVPPEVSHDHSFTSSQTSILEDIASPENPSTPTTSTPPNNFTPPHPSQPQEPLKKKRGRPPRPKGELEGLKKTRN